MQFSSVEQYQIMSKLKHQTSTQDWIISHPWWRFDQCLAQSLKLILVQGAVDARVSGAIVTASECCALIAAMVIILSLVGVNVNGLLLPAGIALAFAAKDLSHNFLAGRIISTEKIFPIVDTALSPVAWPTWAWIIEVSMVIEILIACLVYAIIFNAVLPSLGTADLDLRLCIAFWISFFVTTRVCVSRNKQSMMSGAVNFKGPWVTTCKTLWHQMVQYSLLLKLSMHWQLTLVFLCHLTLEEKT